MHLLDNPIWNALNSAESHLNIGNEDVAYFSPAISPFVGLPYWSSAMQQVLYAQLPATGSRSTIVAEPICFTEDWELVFTTTLHQMVCEKAEEVLDDRIHYRPLGTTDIPAMMALTAITKPGPFLEKTILFGNYYGIFEGEKLIAMAGERLHLNSYTEISAVCTDPAFTGKGLAALLVSMLSKQIFERGKTPFLHVKRDNQRAIDMYKRLGFKHRSDMYFGIFKRK